MNTPAWLWWLAPLVYFVGCFSILIAYREGASRRFWVFAALWAIGLIGMLTLPAPSHGAERTYTLTVPRVGSRNRCAEAETLYTIDSVRVLRYRRQAHPFASAPWIAIQQQRPAIMYQAACRAGDALSITVSLADTGWVNEFTVHNWITTLDGRVFGAWGDACGATVKAW